MSKVAKFSVTTIVSALVVLSFAFIATQSWAGVGYSDKGEALYYAHCAYCHGAVGDGKGPGGTGMTPPPTNLTSDTAMKGVNKGRLYKALTKGMPGTPGHVAGFETAIDADGIFELIAYIEHFGRVEGAHSEKAEQVWNAHCTVCHGIKGDGKGPGAAGMTPPPTNLTSATAMKGVNESRLYKSITKGRPGTAMAGFEKILTADEVYEVILYIETFGGYKK